MKVSRVRLKYMKKIVSDATDDGKSKVLERNKTINNNNSNDPDSFKELKVL